MTIPHFELDTDAAQADTWSHRLASTNVPLLAEHLVTQDRAADAVLFMVEAGGTTADLMDGLVMAGVARRVRRLRDLLPGKRGKRACYEIAEEQPDEID